MYPTKEEFEELLMTREVDWIIDNHVFNDVPFYSSHQPAIHKQTLRAVSRGLRVPVNDICVVGSAQIGFSLSPQKFGVPFSQFSDIDIIIVSSSLFDPSWLDIHRSRYTRGSTLNASTKTSLKEHREFHYIYNGWIYPGSILQVLQIGERWLRTFNVLSRLDELAGRHISGRLYRTWQHARFYHRWSLDKVKETTSL